MCVPSYSVCLKGPQQKCVCCWHSPFNIVWIFHQDPKPCYKSPLFSDLFVHSLCVWVSVRVCVCSDIYLVWNVANVVWLYMSFFCQLLQQFYGTIFFSKNPGGLWCLDWTSLYPASFVQGTLTQALNAGHRRLLTKLRERGGFCVWKQCTRLKIACPSCQCIAIKNSWAGLLPAFSHVKVDSLFVPLSCHNSPFTAALCWPHCASAITEAKSAS